MSVGAILGNSSLMMLAALVLGLAVGGFPSDLPLKGGDISMISLVVMLTLSLSSLDLRNMRIGPHKNGIRKALLLSFVLSTGITLAIAFLFTGDLRSGWVLEASVPAAVSVITFSYLWGGNTESSAVSLVVMYLISLAATPLITLVFMGQAVSEATLLYYIGMLIVIPLTLSQLVKRIITSSAHKGMLINIAFFVMVVAVAGANRDVLLTVSPVLVALIAVAFVRIFGVGLAFYHYCMKKGVDRKDIVTGTLFATYKNTGMAASLALVLIGPEAAVPAAVCMVVEVFWLVFAGKVLFSGGYLIAQDGKLVDQDAP